MYLREKNTKIIEIILWNSNKEYCVSISSLFDGKHANLMATTCWLWGLLKLAYMNHLITKTQNLTTLENL